MHYKDKNVEMLEYVVPPRHDKTSFGGEFHLNSARPSKHVMPAPLRAPYSTSGIYPIHSKQRFKFTMLLYPDKYSILQIWSENHAICPIEPTEGLNLNLVSGIAFHEKLWYDFKDEIRYPARTVTGRVVIPFVGYCQAITGRALFFEPYS